MMVVVKPGSKVWTARKEVSPGEGVPAPRREQTEQLYLYGLYGVSHVHA